MRIVQLNEETRKNILEDLLKRDPNNYTAYESTVQEIVEDVRKNRDQALMPIQRNLTEQIWTAPISALRKQRFRRLCPR